MIYRIDKYYMLVRRFVNASFRLLIDEKWSSTAIDEYSKILTGRGGPLEYVASTRFDIILKGAQPRRPQSPNQSSLPFG